MGRGRRGSGSENDPYAATTFITYIAFIPFVTFITSITFVTFIGNCSRRLARSAPGEISPALARVSAASAPTRRFSSGIRREQRRGVSTMRLASVLPSSSVLSGFFGHPASPLTSFAPRLIVLDSSAPRFARRVLALHRRSCGRVGVP
jgi:hypothetical protein